MSNCKLNNENSIIATMSLQKQVDFFYVVIDNLSEAVILANSKTGNLIYANQSFCKLFGYQLSEIKDLHFSKLHPANFQISAAQGFEKADEHKQPIMNIPCIRKDESIFYAEIRDKKITFNDELCNLATFIDNSQLYIAERAVRESEKKLRGLNADKDRYLKILAHDLRNPFNTLLGFSSLLLHNFRKYDFEKIERQLFIINQTIQKTYNLLSDLLLWTQSQSGLLKFEPKHILFSEICHELLAQLSSNEKNIEILCLAPPDLIIYADSYIFKAVMRNLISNAIKFTGIHGRIEIKAMQTQNFVTISVSDNGIGIGKHEMQKLWSQENHHSTLGTDGERGTGLGLQLCKEFVEKHGGKLWAESEPGKGSSFIFTIPSPF